MDERYIKEVIETWTNDEMNFCFTSNKIIIKGPTLKLWFYKQDEAKVQDWYTYRYKSLSSLSRT